MGPVALPALGLSHWERTLLPQFHACSFDERVEGPSSSGKGAKHCLMRNVLRGLALAAKEQSTDDERVEGPSSSGNGANH